MKQYSESTLMGMTKKDLVQEVLIAYHNQNNAETALRQQAVNVKDWEPVRHGHWENKRGGFWEMAQCSECGSWEPTVGNSHKYCPQCGAKMDGGTDYEA